MDDVIRWIEGDVDDDQVEAIMRALLVNLLDNLPSLLSQNYPSRLPTPCWQSIVALSIALPWSKLISVIL